VTIPQHQPEQQPYHFHRPGIYRHYKGGHYIALFLARDSNNHANREDVVVYMSLTSPYAGAINVRHLSEFCEQVQLPDGGWMPRFEYLGPAPRGIGPHRE
jgi:hypothetical protein